MKQWMNALSGQVLQAQVLLQSQIELWSNGGLSARQQCADADSEDGMTTTEYAVGTLAAAAIAGTLLAIAKSGAFKTMLLGIFKDALNV